MSDKTNKVQGQKAGPAEITKATIISKDDPERSVSVAGGFIEMRYFESILQDANMATYIFADTGRSIDDKTVCEGLPLTGSEPFQFVAKDNNEVN